MVKLSGARILLECLKKEGVDLIFGLPGGAVLPIYDVLYDFQGIRHILVRQEAAAGHAAEGYSRTTGKVGVCLVTSGPATNLVPPMPARAWLDHVAFTGRCRTSLIGQKTPSREHDNGGFNALGDSTNFLVKDAGPGARSSEGVHIPPPPGRPPGHVDLPRRILLVRVVPLRVSVGKSLRRSYTPTYDVLPADQEGRAVASRGPSAGALRRRWRPISSYGPSPELVDLAEHGTQVPVRSPLGLARSEAHRLSSTCWHRRTIRELAWIHSRIASSHRRPLRRPRPGQGGPVRPTR